MFKRKFPIVLCYIQQTATVARPTPEDYTAIRANYPKLDLHFREWRDEHTADKDLIEKYYDGILGTAPTLQVKHATETNKQVVVATLAEIKAGNTKDFQYNEDGSLAPAAPAGVEQQAARFSVTPPADLEGDVDKALVPDTTAGESPVQTILPPT